MAELDKLETVFFGVLEDLKDYHDDLTLVGGWLSFVYSRFLWKKSYVLNCPRPSAYVYHKLATFVRREDEQKKAILKKSLGIYGNFLNANPVRAA